MRGAAAFIFGSSGSGFGSRLYCADASGKFFWLKFVYDLVYCPRFGLELVGGDGGSAFMVEGRSTSSSALTALGFVLGGGVLGGAEAEGGCDGGS